MSTLMFHLEPTFFTGCSFSEKRGSSQCSNMYCWVPFSLSFGLVRVQRCHVCDVTDKFHCRDLRKPQTPQSMWQATQMTVRASALLSTCRRPAVTLPTTMPRGSLTSPHRGILMRRCLKNPSPIHRLKDLTESVSGRLDINGIAN